VLIRLPPSSTNNQVIVSPPDPVAVQAINAKDLKYVVINISLKVPLTKGQFSADVCLNVNQNEDISELCLGFYDEQTGEWKCEDECLEEQRRSSGMIEVCGQTNHFTNFAVLLSGAGGGNPCGSSYLYFTGDWRGDAGVAAGIAFIIVIIGIIIILVNSLFKWKKNRDMKTKLNTRMSHSNTLA